VLIRLNDVSKVFRTDVVETHALRNISLDISAGEFVAITGHSGSGKTSLLNIIGLLEDADSGRYSLDGVDVTELSDKQRSAIRNLKLAFVFQNFNLVQSMTVFENVELPLCYRELTWNDRRSRVARALHRLGLGSRTKHFPSQLSGGQQQRVALARAIAGSPSVLLADEPTGNLDSEMSEQVLDLLREINSDGTAIVMVTHNIDLAKRAQRNVHIADGKIADDSSKRAAS
jgi:putative ABC transport system ATP-binding protein